MLTRKTPDTLAAELTIKGQGQSLTFDVLFHNRRQGELQAVLDAAEKCDEAKADPQYANRQALLFVVKSWDSEYQLTDDDIKAMESDRPGIIAAIFFAYHEARRHQLTKN